MDSLEELSESEYLEIFGGRPTNETTFFYDVGWWIGTGIRKVENLFEE